MKVTEVFQGSEDNGWLKKQNFWFDPNHEHGFEIQDLNALYPEQYFANDHVSPTTVENYCRLVVEFWNKIMGPEETLLSIIEFGSGGGWFTKRFQDLGSDVYGLEGTYAGVNKCMGRGCVNVAFSDFRRPHKSDVIYDIALCTEVAEHIEPPFSATLIKSLCDASDLVWFSFEEPNTNPAHVHHCNEMPAKFWINIFEFYGYGAYRLPDWVYDQCEGRGRYIFYNKSVYEGNQFLQQ